MKNAVFYTAAELAQRGLEGLPDELRSHTHLIYSSPATLAFNSPGAEGFGVKRAGLAIPGSVMLIVSPGCCGRNTSSISRLPQYAGRYFYLTLDETDVVTGRHLKKIPQAVEEVCASLSAPPTVVMVCITCVDALLGTDMERVCRKAQERVGLPVRPCYMYALTREGRKPPMVHVRQSLYSLLEPMKKRGTSVNLLGFFAPLKEDCELYPLLRQLGVKTIREISTCDNYSDYLHMAEANFNLVLHPEARLAAEDIQKRLGIPSIELNRFYQLDRVRRQYRALGGALGVTFDEEAYYQRAKKAAEDFSKAHPSLTFAVGECMNGDPFELSCALLSWGHRVSEIYGTITAENFVWVKKLAQLSPETRIFANLEPTMLYYDCSQAQAHVTIGRDAGYYHPDCPNLPWNSDVQPYGYAAIWGLFDALGRLLEGGNP